MIASIEFNKKGIEKVGFIPCWIEPNGNPKPLDVENGKETIQYIEKITKEAGFKTSFLVEKEKNSVRVQSE